MLLLGFKPEILEGNCGLLLDVSFLAGAGNYLRSEILFNAGISPYRKVGSLSKSELDSLAKSAIAYCAGIS